MLHRKCAHFSFSVCPARPSLRPPFRLASLLRIALAHPSPLPLGTELPSVPVHSNNSAVALLWLAAARTKKERSFQPSQSVRAPDPASAVRAGQSSHGAKECVETVTEPGHLIDVDVVSNNGSNSSADNMQNSFKERRPFGELKNSLF